MKKLLLLLPVIIIFFFSCGDGEDKKPTVPVPSTEEVATRRAKLDERDKKEKKDRIDCNWGLDSNHFKKQKKRDEEFDLDSTISAAPIKANRGKKPPPTTTDPLPPPPTGGGCIFVNTYGREVSGTMWNVYGAFTVGHSGFADPEIAYIILGVAGHFNPWYVTVTGDENVFKSYSIGKKQEVIPTETNEWYGNNAGGVAYIGSYSWTSPAPAFVFTKLLGYNVHNVIEAIAHEAGHTLGLRHQVDCSNGVVVNQYSLYKIMGNSYPLSPVGTWTTGTSSAACAIQDDVAKITAVLSANPAIQ
jgi:reprolysin-like metallo-peptidase family M12B